jgi:hypothetical protein
MEDETKRIPPPVIVGGKPWDPDEVQMDNVLAALRRAKGPREKQS